MKLGIDVKVLSERGAGIGRYAAGLLRSMLRLPRAERPDPIILFTGPQTDRRSLPELPDGCELRHLASRRSSVRALYSIPRAIREEGLDLFHGLDHVGGPLGSVPAKVVVTVHDICPLTHPQWYSPKHRLVIRALLPRILRHADLALVPSEAVKKAVLERGLIPEERVVVLPEGCDSRFTPDSDDRGRESLRTQVDLPERYLLFVGTAEPRKNLQRLLEAFAAARLEEVCLVLAGSPGWRSREILDQRTRLKIEHRVRILGHVPDENLPELYRRALGFVFPSLYEGFGLPVLEAMRCGTPVVASASSAIPEVAGDAALLFDPTSVDELSHCLERITRESELRESLRARGLARASLFTWDEVARRTVDAYNGLLS